MLGTVLVIYYKQISEGYEDRERFVILQKVGLPQSLLLNRKDGKTVLVLTYRAQEGLVFLTLQAQNDARYHLVKVE